MTVRQALRDASARLAAAGVPDPDIDAAWLMGGVLSLTRLEVLARGAQALSDEEYARFEALMRRRLQREPLQYILGETDFMGLRLLTRPGVLIPRNDTEVLCEQALLRLRPGMRVLDLCTGSGAIAVSLKAHCPQALVWAGDIAPEAIALARENAALHGADVNFALGDLFAPFAGARYDMICCNPPYIPTGDLPALQAEVKREPRLALDGGGDGLNFYRRLLARAPLHLLPGGWLLLELGDGQADAVQRLAALDFEAVSVYDDAAMLPRTLAAQWKGTHAFTG
ncbi:MAG: peptide chain release factor N(5)-glutamine methyltransferase [Clostridiales bacterium]|nr:peptide chain release factor N(5)-glutamine methyltransferase [Clostridiales bacterium]